MEVEAGDWTRVMAIDGLGIQSRLDAGSIMTMCSID